MRNEPDVAIIGAGPAGLFAAEMLSAAGKRVTVCERMPSVARKFLMAGRGGLNLTHSEPLDSFISRYADAQTPMAPMLAAFTPANLRAWADGLGQETFVGSSGRVFPKAMKASPLLRAWLTRLAAQGVTIRTRSAWTGWDDAGRLTFANAESVQAKTTLLALGGASWPKLGSDGSWVERLAARGVALTPFRPANVGFEAPWSEHFRTRFAGHPLKTVSVGFGQHRTQGDVLIAAYGLEGGAIYTLSAPLRDALAGGAPIRVEIDLRPSLSVEAIATKLARAKSGDSVASTLRKTLNLSPAAIHLLREQGALPRDPAALAALIKAAPVTLTAPRGLARAISTAGGVAWSAVDERLQLRAIPGVYVAGEMLDWEAPTGGY